MKQALREALGKAAYEGRLKYLNASLHEEGGTSWEEITNEDYREMCRATGEAVVMSFCSLIAPLAQLAVNLLDQVFDAEEIERLAATPLDLDRLRYDEHKEPA